MSTHFLVRQRGVSLISLMIGLVISMILVVGALVLYQNTAKSTALARQDVLADAQRTSSFMSAGITLQDAGFGIALPVVGTDLVWLQGATLSDSTHLLSAESVLSPTAGTGNAIIWSENITGTMRCSAILAPQPSDAIPNVGGLRKLGPVGCTNAAAWNILNWNSDLNNLPRTISAAPAAPVVIQIETTTCKPFGITTNNGALRVTFHANNSIGLPLRTSQCLINFPAPV